MKLARQGKINYLQPEWANSPRVRAGFTTRNGGVSRAPYNSLNLGYNTGDLRASVDGNRSTVTRAFDLQPHMLLTVQQTHGSDILILNEPNHDLSHFQSIECDAIITDQPGIMLGILVADCFPVILYAPDARVGAVVHVGWRGAAAGLLGKTILSMQREFGIPPESLRAAVGPGIGAHRYEVDRVVRDAFRAGVDHWSRVATETELGKWLLDLRLSCSLQLQQSGVSETQIDAAEQDTCCHRELFFSYRRDHGETGRQMGFILMSPN